jgi:hypothetical protein
MTDQPPDRTRAFFGAGLLALGVLMFTLCGLCTLVFAGWTVRSAFDYPMRVGAFLGSFLLYGIFGGLPTLLGFLVMRAGRRRLRANAPKPPPSAPPPG